MNPKSSAPASRAARPEDKTVEQVTTIAQTAAEYAGDRFELPVPRDIGHGLEPSASSVFSVPCSRSVEGPISARDRRFESVSLQRGVACEPEDDIDIPVPRGSPLSAGDLPGPCAYYRAMLINDLADIDNEVFVFLGGIRNYPFHRLAPMGAGRRHGHDRQSQRSTGSRGNSG